MTDQRQLLDEQIAYYRARASEYDDWWFRRGRYDHGDAQREAWGAEIVRLETALDEARPIGTVLELACGTGVWTERLARSATSVTAIDVSPEVLAINVARVRSDRVRYVREDLFKWEPKQRFDFVFFGFWLSHVPSERFDTFWTKVEASLKPAGRVFFIDSVRSHESTAANHVLPEGRDVIAEREPALPMSTVRLKPDTTCRSLQAGPEIVEKQILLTSYSPVCIFVLLRQDQPLLDTGGVAQQDGFWIDRDDRVAAGH